MFKSISNLIANAFASAMAGQKLYLPSGDDSSNGAFGGSRSTKPTFYKSKARAKFKAQRIARRANRKGA